MALAISETATSVFSYHLRDVSDGRYYFGGGSPPAVCGAALGWDTKFPLSAWGKVDHIPSKWCAKCARMTAEATKPGPVPAADRSTL